MYKKVGMLIPSDLDVNITKNVIFLSSKMVHD